MILKIWIGQLSTVNVYKRNVFICSSVIHVMKECFNIWEKELSKRKGLLKQYDPVVINGKNIIFPESEITWRSCKNEILKDRVVIWRRFRIIWMSLKNMESKVNLEYWLI